MIVFPQAKINLGLKIIGKRPDGFHEIETILFPIGLCDALEVIAKQGDSFSFSTSGLPIIQDRNPNLCEKAWQLLEQEYDLPPVQMYLHKRIPIGAGLGGGSSDAANTLCLLSELFGLNASESILYEMASSLGSDCPFFLNPVPTLATGRGEILNPLPGLDLNGWHLVLITPDINISTAIAYSGVKPGNSQLPLSQIIQKPVKDWKDLLKNDFEESIFEKFPDISQIKEKLYHLGAAYASMSGSGSSVYGLFSEPPTLPFKNIFKNCFIWEEKLSG